MFATVAQLYSNNDLAQDTMDELSQLRLVQLYDPLNLDFTQSYFDKSDIASDLAV